MKKTFSIFAALVTMLAAMQSPAATAKSGKYTWEYEVKDGVAIVTAVAIGNDWGVALTIPSSLSGYPVKVVELDSVIDDPADLGDSGYEEAIVSVTVPNSVTNISYFTSLESVTSISLPSGLLTIGNHAFSGCDVLPRITIPASVTKIGNCIFRGCSALTSVTVASGNTKFTMHSGALYTKDMTELIEVMPYVSGSFTIPAGVKYIRPEAFWSSKVSSVHIPASVVEIGNDAFARTVNLSTITVADGNTAFVVEDGILYNASRTRLVRCTTGYSGAYASPSTLQWMDDYAFYNCTMLSSVVLNEGFVEFHGLGSASNIYSPRCSAFSKCNSLQYLYLPPSTAPAELSLPWECVVELARNSGIYLSSSYSPSYYDVTDTFCWVAFEPNGGVLDDRVRKLTSGDTLGTLPVPVRRGWKFDGWWLTPFKSSSSGNRQIFENTQITYNATYVAHWIEDDSGGGGGGGDDPDPPPSETYWTVTFDANGGSVGDDTRSVKSGAAVGTLPTPTWPNRSFLGWYTAANGGTKISATTKITRNVTYYAHWLLDSSAYVTVMVTPGQEALGKVTGGNKTFKPGDKVTLKATANKGAAFSGWTLDGELIEWSPSLTYIATGEDVTIMAEFIAARDDSLRIDCPDRAFRLGEQVYSSVFDMLELNSGSWATLKITGLPTGLKYDEKGGFITGAPSKVGVYYVTCTSSNQNGYKQIAIGEWTVGPATNGDYDDIGIDWDGLENFESETYDPQSGDYVCSPVEWRTGEDVWFSLYYAIGDPDGITSITVSGLPAGLKAPTCPSNQTCGYPPGSYMGTLTKAGKYKLTVTAKYSNRTTRKAVKTIIVKDSGSRYVGVVSEDESRGTVTGSGVYAIGSTVRLTAKPKTGFYFACWSGCDTLSGTVQKSSDSFIVPYGSEPMEISAYFISRDEDEVEVYGDGDWDGSGTTWNVDVSDWMPSLDFTVGAITEAKTTVKGLPAGMKLEFLYSEEGCNTYRIYCQDTSKLKPGTVAATVTVKTATGLTRTYTIKIAVPNLRSDVFRGLEYEKPYMRVLGISDACFEQTIAYSDANYTVSAAGLPPGLKLDIGGVYDGERDLMLRGTPTKAGIYTVTLTAKGRWDTQKATFTVEVQALPDYTVGTFNGFIRNEYGETVGTATFTSTAAGKLTAKVIVPEGTFSFSESAWNCGPLSLDDADDQPFTAWMRKTVGGRETMFQLDVWKEYSAWNNPSQALGTFYTGDTEYEIVPIQRGQFGKDDPAEAREYATLLKGTYKLMEDGYSDGFTTLREAYWSEKTVDCTITIAANGTAKLSGKHYGASISGTSMLMFDAEGPFVAFCPIASLRVCAHSSYSSTCFTERTPVPLIFRF